MDEQYWDALTNRIHSAESFLQKSSNSYSPSFIEKDLNSVPERSVLTGDERGRPMGEVSAHRNLSPGTFDVRTFHATLEQLNSTIEDGRIAFKNLIHMSDMACFLGFSLVGLSAISGLFLQREVLTLIFGGLGISILIAMFVLKPGDKIQVALANLIQAQTVSTDFYNQLQFWAPYAREAASTEDRRQASQALHEATTFALKALHEYVEPSPSGMWGKKEL